ncbi:MAG: hypothetical protein JOZ27_01800 [Caulobacteraceae bacterium]|nr:hypothetical protein [Caulobacteraceae bacterium]
MDGPSRALSTREPPPEKEPPVGRPFVPSFSRPRWSNLAIVAGIIVFWVGLALKLFA